MALTPDEILSSALLYTIDAIGAMVNKNRNKAAPKRPCIPLAQAAVELLNKGANPSSTDAKGCSALLKLVSIRRSKTKAYEKLEPEGFAEALDMIADALFEAGVDVHGRTEQGLTTLMKACECGHHVAAMHLVHSDVDLTVRIKESGETALLLACDMAKDDVAVALMHKLYFAECMHFTKFGASALMRLISKGHLTAARQWLGIKGMDVLRIDNNRNNALHYIARACLTHDGDTADYIALARELVEKRHMRVDAQGSEGATALMMFCMAECSQGAMLMLEYEADVNIVREGGFTALMLAAKMELEEVVLALLQKGADTNALTEEGDNVLRWGHFSDNVLRALLDKGADVHVSNTCTGATPLSYCVEADRAPSTIGLIREAMAKTEPKKAPVEPADKEQGVDDGGAELLEAITQGNKMKALKLIQGGANVDAQDDKENSAIILACHKSMGDVVLALLDKGADVNELDEYGLSAFNWAINRCSEKVCLALLAKRQNPDPGGSLEYNMAYSAAVENGFTDVALALIDSGMSFDEEYTQIIDRKRDLGLSPLHKAIDKGLTKVAKRLISMRVVNMDKQDHLGQTALVHAVLKGHVDIALRLVKAGAAVDPADNKGNTALIYSCILGLGPVALAITEKAVVACVDARNNNGDTALICACARGMSDVAIALLRKGNDVNTPNTQGNTALIRACCKGLDTVAMLLVAKGADVQAQNTVGDTALIGACTMGLTDPVSLLIKKNADVNKLTKAGITALMAACRHGHLPSVQQLLIAGADPNQETGVEGLSPLSVTENSDIKALLREYGAR